MSLVIEPTTPADLGVVAALEHAVGADAAHTAESLAAGDAAIVDEGGVVIRRIARDDAPVGHAAISRFLSATDEATYRVRVGVVPAARRAGVGTLLHSDAAGALPRPGDATLFGYVPGTEEALGFAEALGYREEGRMVESRIDPRSVDPPLHASTHDIEPLSALMDRKPDWFARLHGLVVSVVRDAPFPIEEQPAPAASFRRRVVDAEDADLDTLLVATDGDEWIGYTSLRPHGGDPGRWTQLFTGVRRSHRGSGVATALKRAGLRAAAAKGATEVGTLNHEDNRAIRAINDRLGFTPIRTRHLMVRRPATG